MQIKTNVKILHKFHHQTSIIHWIHMYFKSYLLYYFGQYIGDDDFINIVEKCAKSTQAFNKRNNQKN
jgi:hypothetical protein